MSASNPDLSSLTLGVEDKNDFPEHVVKVYRADQSFRFLLIHKVSPSSGAHQAQQDPLKESASKGYHVGFRHRWVAPELERGRGNSLRQSNDVRRS